MKTNLSVKCSSIEILFEEERGVSLIITANEFVGVVHGSGVHCKPSDSTHIISLQITQLKNSHILVCVVLISIPLFFFVIEVSDGTPIDAGIQ